MFSHHDADPIGVELLEEPMKITSKDSEQEAAEYDFETIKSSHAVRLARTNGLTIVYPDDYQLQIDIDRAQALATFNKNLPKFKMHIAEVVKEERTPSKSGDPDKMHITLTLAVDFDTPGRIAFQAFLGSDPTRELLSYIRFTHDDEHPTLFYEKKQLLLKAGTEEN